MKKILVILVLFSLSNLSFAGQDGCKLETTVTGTLERTSVAGRVIVGTIHLELTNEKGRVVFNEDGGILTYYADLVYVPPGGEGGEAPPSNPNMDYDLLFNDGSKLESDSSLIEWDPSLSYDPSCYFATTETIRNFWGTKSFKRATGEIIATGFIDFCDAQNPGHSVLSGTVCLK